MTVQTYDRSVIQPFVPFKPGRDEAYRRLDAKAQESYRRMLRLAKEKLGLTPMIDPADGTIKLVHEDGRFLSGYIGQDSIQLRLGADYDAGFSRESFRSMAQYLKAVRERFDTLTARKAEAESSPSPSRSEAGSRYITRAAAARILQVSESFLNSTISYYRIHVQVIDGQQFLSRHDVEMIGPPTSEALEADIKAFVRSAPRRLN